MLLVFDGKFDVFSFDGFFVGVLGEGDGFFGDF